MLGIENISAALLNAATACAQAQEEHEAVYGSLSPLLELLGLKCASFYFLEDQRRPIRVSKDSGLELLMPATAEIELVSIVAAAPLQLLTSNDGTFKKLVSREGRRKSQHLEVWVLSPAGAGRLGIIGLFGDLRDLASDEKKVVRTFANQLGTALVELRGRKHRGAAMPAKVLVPEGPPEQAKAAAWEIIHPLTAMLGYVELLQAEKLNERARDYVVKLRQQVERAQRIVMPSESAPAPKAFTALEPPEHLQPSTEAPASLPSRNGEFTAAPRVLLIHRNAAVLEFESSVLSTLGVEAIACTSASDALKQLASQPLSAVVLDDEMEEDWEEGRLFDWICQNRPELADRVLMTVASCPREEVRQIIETARVPHVSKPLQMLPFLEHTRQLLGLSANANRTKFLN